MLVGNKNGQPFWASWGEKVQVEPKSEVRAILAPRQWNGDQIGVWIEFAWMEYPCRAASARPPLKLASF